MSTHLNHITISSGHLRRVPRSKTSEDILTFLAPIIAAEGGDLGVRGLHADLWRLISESGPLPGTVAFQIAPGPMSTLPYVLCVACWAPEPEDEAWKLVGQMATSATPIMFAHGRTIPQRPPLPWLAVVLMPGILTLPLNLIGALVDAEECIAWAAIEHEMRRLNDNAPQSDA